MDVGDRWVGVLHESAGMTTLKAPRVARAARLSLPAAPPRRRRAGRGLAGHLLVPHVRHWVDQPPRPAARQLAPEPPGLGVPPHPGPPRRRRHGVRAAAARQALDGLPALLDPAAAASARPPAARGGTGFGRCPRRGCGLPARDRAGQRDHLVPVVILLPRHPLRRRLGDGRRARRAHRGQAARRPRGPGRPSRRGRTSWRRTLTTRARPDGGRRLGRCRAAHRRRHRPVAASGVRLQREVGRRARRSARQQERPRGRRHGLGDRPGVPPRDRVRRPVGVADPRRPARDDADGRQGCRSPASRAGARTASGPASGCATCSTSSVPRAGRPSRSPRSRSTGRSASPTCRPSSRTTTSRCSRSVSTARRSRSTTATRPG